MVFTLMHRPLTTFKWRHDRLISTGVWLLVLHLYRRRPLDNVYIYSTLFIIEMIEETFKKTSKSKHKLAQCSDKTNGYTYIATVRRNSQGRITIRGPHSNVRRGPFSHTRSHDFLWGFFSGVTLRLFFTQKVDDLFSRRYILTYAERSNVKPAWEKVGIWSGGGTWRRGPLPWYNRHSG